MTGYNDHLPGIAAIKERKRQERVRQWHEREAIKQALRARRQQIGTEAFIRERLGGSLRAPGGTIRRAPHG